MIRITDKTIYYGIITLIITVYFCIGYITYQYSTFDVETEKGNVAALFFGFWVLSLIGIIIGVCLVKYDHFERFMGELSRGRVGIDISVPLWKREANKIDKLYEEFGRASVNGNDVLADKIFEKIQSLEN